MLNVEFEIGPTTPVFPNAENPEQISVSELLERECLLKHPIVSRRYEMFRKTHSPQHMLTEFISLLRQASINAQLTDLDANGFIAFYALSMCREYQQVREDALKLPPEQFTLSKLMQLARSFETAQSALKDMSKATTNFTGGGGSGVGFDERLKIVNGINGTL